VEAVEENLKYRKDRYNTIANISAEEITPEEENGFIQ
jgi:hypothetical protein